VISTPRLAVVCSTAVLALGAPAVALASGHGHSGSHGKKGQHGRQDGTHGHKGHGHSSGNFTAVGKVVSVDPEAMTITLNDKGGTRALHGTTVTVSVTDATTIKVDDQAATIDAVVAPDHIVVKGDGAGSTLTAARVNAASGDADSGETDD
jgi:hypothetical protein